MKKYLKLIWLFGKWSLMDQMAYRGTFLLAVFAKISRMIIPFIFFQAVFLKVPQVAGWTFQEVAVLLATYITIESLAVITFHRNMAYYLPDSLRKGEFDFLLVKPVNILFFTSFKVIDFFDLTSALTALGIWIYIFCLWDINIAPANIILFFFACLVALGFWYALLLILASISFWTIVATGLGRFLESLTRTARYPAHIFKGAWHIFFFYFFPLAFISTLPAGVLLDKIEPLYLLYGFIFTVFFLLLAVKFWQYGLKHYQSAA